MDLFIFVVPPANTSSVSRTLHMITALKFYVYFLFGFNKRDVTAGGKAPSEHFRLSVCFLRDAVNLVGRLVAPKNLKT